MHKFIISGGPGAGKSTLLEALRASGFYCVDEASRQLIQEQVAEGSQCLPWTNLACFARLALTRMLADCALALEQTNEELAFFDRGIPDILAYLQVGGLPIEDSYYQAVRACDYQPLVFIAPPWQSIYVNDAERWQTFEEATALYQALVKTYQLLGFTVAELPKASVDERVTFVLSQVNNLAGNKQIGTKRKEDVTELAYPERS